jgi:membrane fusion protein, copper/silver efflux system
MKTTNRSESWLLKQASTIGVLAISFCAIVAVLLIRAPQQSAEPVGTSVWTCSMHPQIRMDKPGKCPICNMDLSPVAELSALQQRVEKRAGLLTAPVAFHELHKEIRAAGKLDYNERRVAFLTARVDGRVERVYADVTGTQVKANDHLVDIYSPALVVGQGELIGALESRDRRPSDRFAETTLESARLKLQLLGLLPEQIARIESTREKTTHLTIYAPIGGVIVEKNVREQQYVKEGDMLYRIAELDPIWLYMDIYERDLSWVRYGQSVDVSVEAYPGETFRGTIVFIDPFLNDEQRTLKVRVNLTNPGQRLKPAMYASATIRVRLQANGTPMPTGMEGKYICPMHPEIIRDVSGRCSICDMPLERVPDSPPATAISGDQPTESTNDAAGTVLAVPKSAVLDTGRRQVTYRKRKDGAYELVALKLGPLAESADEQGKSDAYFPVLAGLAAGDEVVVQGGFLLDSQRQIEGMPSLLYAEGQAAPAGHAGHVDTNAASPPGAGDHKH